MTHSIPKPMIEANGKTLLIHIINQYLKYDIKNFIILVKYKKNYISDYFRNLLNESKIESDMFTKNDITVKVLDTGLETMTGGRVKKGIEYKNDDQNFFLTYGDALSNIKTCKI